MTDKQIIEEDMVNAKDFCPYYSCEVDCYESRMCQWFVDTLQQLKRKEQECEELRKQLERKEENYQKLLSKSNKYIHNLVDENVQDISNLARQLDQLKATNEELKNTINEAKNSGLDLKSFLLSEAIQKEYEEQIDKLKSDNEELKNEIEACYNQVEDFDIIATSKSNKLKQAEQKLERIRELATALCYKVMSDGVVILQEDILQIIDEV